MGCLGVVRRASCVVGRGSCVIIGHALWIDCGYWLFKKTLARRI